MNGVDPNMVKAHHHVHQTVSARLLYNCKIRGMTDTLTLLNLTVSEEKIHGSEEKQCRGTSDIQETSVPAEQIGGVDMKEGCVLQGD